MNQHEELHDGGALPLSDPASFGDLQSGIEIQFFPEMLCNFWGSRRLPLLTLARIRQRGQVPG